jgi:pyruvate formate lyase activating enzyme
VPLEQSYERVYPVEATVGDQRLRQPSIALQQAWLYEKARGEAVICNLCAHRCFIPPGQSGICKVRENRAGILYTLVSDHVIAQHVDPIEKKPFFHFLPATRSFSIAAAGCNFHCRFCQNWEISQLPRLREELVLGDHITPEAIVHEALRSRCRTIAYTYTEPTIFFELAYTTAKLAASRGLKNLFVSNGYITSEALKMIQPYLDAVNIDLKGFNDKRYRRICGAKLQPVLDSIRLAKELGIWLEVTTLVIPGHNDSDDELEQMAAFLADVDCDIPWHLSAFFPAYQMLDTRPTNRETLIRAWEIGKAAGLHYVYCGNLPDLHADTSCYRCGRILIERRGFRVTPKFPENGRCPACQTLISGMWENESTIAVSH